MTRVLISGASGFVGSNVLDFLLKKTDWEFTCVASWRHHGSPLRINPRGKRVTVVTHDLTGPLPDLGDFDYILNLASESHVDRSIADPVSFIETNVSIVLMMLEYARKHPTKKFVHFSTDEVLGSDGYPSNPYAASKAAQETIATAYWRTYDIPVVITQSNNIIGPSQDPEKFVPKTIELIKKRQRVAIHAANGIPGKRYFNPVENISAALYFILTLPSQKEESAEKQKMVPIYQLPGGREITNLEMAQAIAKRLGKRLNYKLVEAEDIRPGYDLCYPGPDDSLSKLGFVPPLSLWDGLEWIRHPSLESVKQS
jgi:dTDP-glucose 4,6-dehydratase